MVFMYVIKVPSVLVTSTKKLNFLNSLSFATNFANKTMFSKFFSVCYLLRKSSLKFLFFHSKTVRPFKFHMIRIYSQTCRNSRPQVACNKRDSGIVFLFSCEFCKIFKNTFFNRTPSVAASAYDQFLLRLSKKDSFFCPKMCLYIILTFNSVFYFLAKVYQFLLSAFQFFNSVFHILTSFFNIFKVS